jgi:serine protein kinase
VDTAKDSRLGRIFMNRTIRTYPAFREFYGMEETIERIVSFFRHAAQGLEERKQILYLLGPVGGGKSSLAERLKALMEVHPIYVLKAGDEVSPVFESPLGLFDPDTMGDEIQKRYGVPRRRLTGLMSPWALKRLDEFNGDISRFKVIKVRPSRLRQIAIAKTEPGDENNQDIPTPIPTRAASTGRTRAFSNSSRCSRRRSRCCIRCSRRRRRATTSAPRTSARSRSPA